MNAKPPTKQSGRVRRRWLALSGALLLSVSAAKIWWNGQSVVVVIANDSRSPLVAVQVRSVLGEAAFGEVLPEESVSCRLNGEKADREIEITWAEEGQDHYFATHAQAGERLVVRTYPGAEPLVSRSPGLWLRLSHW